MNINNIDSNNMAKSNQHGAIEAEKPRFDTLTHVLRRIMITSIFREQDRYKRLMGESWYGSKLPKQLISPT